MKHCLVLIAAVAAVAALAGCNKSPQVDAKNASVAEVAQKVREANAGGTFVNPGKWQSKVTIDAFEVPGMPPEFAARMKSRMAQMQERTFETCLTKEEAKRPNEDFFAGRGSACRYDHFTMGDGKIDAQMRCGGTDGATQVMTMVGTYAPDSYNMQMAMSRQGGRNVAAGTTMKMRIDSHRVGECTGNEMNAKDNVGQ